MNDGMLSEGAVSIQTTGAMGAGIRSGCSCPLSYWNEAGLSVIAQRRPSLSWLCARDKIACFFYISLPEHLCGILSQAKWTEPLPIRELVLFNIETSTCLWNMSSELLSYQEIIYSCFSDGCLWFIQDCLSLSNRQINHAFSHLKQLAQC